MGISTDPPLLDVELPSALMESPSVSTFLPEEEASICPLLSTNSSTPLAFSHPLTPSADIDNDSNNSNLGICEDTKAETSSSSGSSSGIGMDVTDTAATSLFNHNSYHHLRKNNNEVMQDSKGMGVKGHLVTKSSNDTPSFVSWNWPLIRKCTFFIFMSSLLAMCAVVVAMIITLPKTCNPKTAWYRGSVFYEIFPASYQDSNNDGLGDLRGITKRIDYLSALGVGAVRLNSIFTAEHYPDDYNNVTSLVNIATVIGSTTDLLQLSRALHAKNISLILDLPIFPYLKQLEEAKEANYTTNSNVTEAVPIETDNLISIAIQKWIGLGVDGFYIKGLEMYTHDDNLLNNIAEWKHILGPQRALIISNDAIEKLSTTKANKILEHVDLVDVHLDVFNGTQQIMQQIQAALKGILAPREDGPWIQWSLGGVDEQRLSRQLNGNASLAATILQLMLPGSPNIFYGDEIALENVHDPHNEHTETKHLHHLSTMEWSDAQKFTSQETLPWLPKSSSFNLENFEQVSRMIHLRDRSPSIYKNAICKASQNIPNTQVRNSRDDIIVVERIYPRRNSFVSISNFGQKMVQMDMTSMYYSGHVMLGNTQSEKIYFGEFKIGGLESIVVRLDK